MGLRKSFFVFSFFGFPLSCAGYRIHQNMIRSATLLLVAFVTTSAIAKPKGECVFGKIQVVDSFPDYKVRVVDSFPDLKVQVVDSFPDKPGKWQMVKFLPDYKIQFVKIGEDFTIQYVRAFPGVR